MQGKVWTISGQTLIGTEGSRHRSFLGLRLTVCKNHG